MGFARAAQEAKDASAGGADCLALIVTDLTQRKRNQEIIAAGRLARTILEQAAVPIVVTDPEGKIIQANHAVEMLIGRPVLLRSSMRLRWLDPSPNCLERSWFWWILPSGRWRKSGCDKATVF
jgi:PAS domain-containing protein